MARGDAWFKFYPTDWLRDTRGLTLEQRGAYIDAICIQMEREGPIPDDVKWLAHQLHVSSRKAQSIVEQLLEAKMLRRTEFGLSNSKCEKVIAERTSQRFVISEAAAVRERTKRESTLNQSRTNTEPTPKLSPIHAEKPKSVNEINKPEPPSWHEAGSTRARVDLDKKKEERRIDKIDPPSVDMPREGEEHIGAGVFVNCETIRHRDFSISLKGIEMQLIGTVPMDEIKAVASGHALQWALDIESGKRNVVPANTASFIRGSIQNQRNKLAESEVRKKVRGSRHVPLEPGQSFNDLTKELLGKIKRGEA